MPTAPVSLSGILSELTDPLLGLPRDEAMKYPGYLLVQGTAMPTYYVLYGRDLSDAQELFARVTSTLPGLKFEDVGPDMAPLVSVGGVPMYWALMLTSGNLFVLHLTPAGEYVKEQIMAGSVGSLGDVSRYRADGSSGFIAAEVATVWDSTGNIVTGALIPAEISEHEWAWQVPVPRGEWLKLN